MNVPILPRRLRRGAALCLMSLATATAQAQGGTSALAAFDTAWASLSRTYYDTLLLRGRWASTHDSLRRALGDDPSRESVRAALRRLIAVPGQSHFALIPAESFPTSGGGGTGAPGTVGLDLRMIGDTLVVWRVAPGSPAAEADLRPGDVVTMLAGDSVATIARRLASAFPDDPAHARLLVNSLGLSRVRQSVGDTARISVRGADGMPRSLALVHRPAAGHITRYGNLPPLAVRLDVDSVRVGRGRRATNIPVIHWSAFFPVIAAELDRALFDARDAKGIILDLRGNPGGVIGMIGGVAGHFTDTSANLGTMVGRGSTLFLRTNPRVVDGSGTRRPTINVPVAVLVDGMSASSSEFFAAGLQALGRARVFGDRTSGQALPANMLRLPGGDVLMSPIADHVDANGRRIEGVGVRPDTWTPLTTRALRAGRDPALDAARDWLDRSIVR